MIVPSFSIGRTQDLLYRINRLQAENRIPRIPFYVDSPMATSVTGVYASHADEHDLLRLHASLVRIEPRGLTIDSEAGTAHQALLVVGALPEGATTVLIVVAIYLVVQALESYIITPLIQQEKVSLPPALIIAVQLLFGVLFGLLGLALATPIAAVARTLVREAYVGGYLEREEITSREERDRA